MEVDGSIEFVDCSRFEVLGDFRCFLKEDGPRKVENTITAYLRNNNTKMATCDSFIPQQPIVLLTNVMAEDLPAIEESAEIAEETTNETDRNEQTEPLDLCVNMVEFVDCSNVSIASPKDDDPFRMEALKDYYEDGESEENEPDDDDVIFVKEYRIGSDKNKMESKVMRRNGNGLAGTPRRNPVRRTRSLQIERFKEYTDGSVLDYEKNGNDDETENYEPYARTNDEDVDDWKVEMCRNKPKRRYLAATIAKPKFESSRRKGRRRKALANLTNANKVGLSDLDELVEENLVLLKDFVLATCNRSKNADVRGQSVEMFRQQAEILAILRNKSKNSLLRDLIDKTK